MRPCSLWGDGMKMEWVSIVALIVTTINTAVHLVMDYKKAKLQQHDPIWDAAIRLTAELQGSADVDTFAQNYQELKAFYDNGCSLDDCTNCTQLRQKMLSRSGKSKQRRGILRKLFCR